MVLLLERTYTESEEWFSVFLGKVFAVGVGFGSLITLLFFCNSLQVKPAQNPCLVYAKVSNQDPLPHSFGNVVEFHLLIDS